MHEVIGLILMPFTTPLSVRFLLQVVDPWVPRFVALCSDKSVKGGTAELWHVVFNVWIEHLSCRRIEMGAQ